MYASLFYEHKTFIGSLSIKSIDFEYWAPLNVYLSFKLLTF